MPQSISFIIGIITHSNTTSNKIYSSFGENATGAHGAELFLQVYDADLHRNKNYI
jgi:hypothetical protein